MKRLLWNVCIGATLVATGCKHGAGSTSGALSGAEAASWYKACWEQYNDRKWDEFSKCYATGATSTEAGNPEKLEGREKIVEAVKNGATAVPDGKGDVQLTLVNGSKLMGITHYTGTQSGTMKIPNGEVPASNKPVAYLMSHRIDVDPAGGVAKESWVWDVGTMMSQIGMSPMPARQPSTLKIEHGVVVAENNDTEKLNLEAHQKVIDAFNNHDQSMFELLSDDVVRTAESEPKDNVGKNEVKTHITELWGAFSDIKMNVDELWAAGDYTVLSFHGVGTNDGDMKSCNISKTGKTVDVPMHEVVKWENGKAKEIYHFYNGMQFAQQLGLDKNLAK